MAAEGLITMDQLLVVILFVRVERIFCRAGLHLSLGSGTDPTTDRCGVRSSGEIGGYEF